jgi:two-component system chemotaxis response regulator CheY
MRVLIVDDSRVLRMYLRTIMQGLGWACDEAECGPVAIEKVQDGPTFTLALLDVNMPGMNGIECLRRLREKLSPDSLKVMMVTTEGDFPLMTDALGSGADEFLMKPFTRENLKAKLMLMGLPVERQV